VKPKEGASVPPSEVILQGAISVSRLTCMIDCVFRFMHRPRRVAWETTELVASCTTLVRLLWRERTGLGAETWFCWPPGDSDLEGDLRSAASCSTARCPQNKHPSRPQHRRLPSRHRQHLEFARLPGIRYRQSQAVTAHRPQSFSMGLMTMAQHRQAPRQFKEEPGHDSVSGSFSFLSPCDTPPITGSSVTVWSFLKRLFRAVSAARIAVGNPTKFGCFTEVCPLFACSR
jgi:hypothetical protein